MGKYERVYRQQPPLRQLWQVHPIWRGIGCIFILLLPILSYAAAFLIVRENIKHRWIQIPNELVGFFIIPRIGRIYYIDLAVAIIFMVMGFGLLITLYAMAYRAVAPPYYGPLDAPPIRYRKRRR